MKKTLEQELAALRRDVKAISAHLAESMNDSYETARDRAEEYAEELSEEARSKWQAAKEYGRRGKDYVEDHPWQSIGASLAVGFLLGFLLRRRD